MKENEQKSPQNERKNSNVNYEICEKSRKDGLELFENPVIRAVFERLRDK